MNKIPLMPRFLSGPLFSLLAFVLPVLGAAWLIAAMPQWYQPERIRLHLASGNSRVLGADELAAVSAAQRHVEFFHDADAWMLRNVSREHKLLLRRAGEEAFRPVRGLTLRPGTAVCVSTGCFKVRDSGSDALALQQYSPEDAAWTFDGIELARNGVVQRPCRDSMKQGVRDEWNRIMPPRLRRYTPLQLGGSLHCGTRLPLPDTAPAAMDIIRSDSGYALRRGVTESHARPEVSLPLAGGARSLDDLAVRIRPGDHIIVGYSQYRLQPRKDLLTLIPVHRLERRLDPPSSKPALEQIWRRSDLFEPPHLDVSQWMQWNGLYRLALPLVAALLIWLVWPASAFGVRVNRLDKLAIGLAAAVSAFAAGMYLYAAKVPAGWPLLFAWGGMSVWLLAPWRRAGSRWLLGLLALLLGAGLLVQLQLALGAAQSHWSGHLARSASLSAASLWGAWALYRLHRIKGGRIFPRFAPAVYLRLLFLLAMGGLLWQLGSGSEGGVGGIQPVEFAKLALLITAAHALARRRLWLDWNERMATAWVWVGFMMPALVMSLLVAVILIVIRDFSPLALMLAWGGGVVWAYLRLHSSPRARRLGAWAMGAALALALAGLWAVKQNPAYAGFLQQADRFATWAAPQLHPHSGDQVQRAMQAVQDGGWLGRIRDDPGGIHVNAGRLMGIPAIQDDFAPAFMLNRFGLAFGALLMLLQTALVLSLLVTAQRLHLAHVERGLGDHRRLLLGWFGYFLLYGAAFVLAGHFLVSWGTNTGFLPVMGQPMPFVSSAGSHLVLFVFPLLMTGVVLGEESGDEKAR